MKYVDMDTIEFDRGTKDYGGPDGYGPVHSEYLEPILSPENDVDKTVLKNLVSMKIEAVQILWKHKSYNHRTTVTSTSDFWVIGSIEWERMVLPSFDDDPDDNDPLDWGDVEFRACITPDLSMLLEVPSMNIKCQPGFDPFFSVYQYMLNSNHQGCRDRGLPLLLSETGNSSP